MKNDKDTKILQEAYSQIREAEYVPYIGGAGPSEDQVHNNNLALSNALTKLGVTNKIISIEKDILDDPVEIVLFSINNKEYIVNYDRWGYVLTDNEFGKDLTDQTSLEDTVNYIKNLLPKETKKKRDPLYHYQSYTAWKRAVLQYWSQHGQISFYGDKDIGGAQMKNRTSGLVRQVGEWEGTYGEVFD